MDTFRSYEGGHSERWYKSNRDTLSDFHCEYLFLFALLVLKTFQTEQDFAQIAGAGLNYVRIPLPFWAIETRGSEPFLANVAWTCVSLFSHSIIAHDLDSDTSLRLSNGRGNTVSVSISITMLFLVHKTAGITLVSLAISTCSWDLWVWQMLNVPWTTSVSLPSSSPSPNTAAL